MVQQGKQFANQWVTHGQGLRASVAVLHRFFVVLAVDEQHQAASGCSIDSSVGFVRALTNALGSQGAPVDFFDRTLLAFWIDNAVELVSLTEAKQQITEGLLSPDTITFNNLVSTKANLANRWRVSVQNSWLARYLPKVNA